LHGSNLHPIQKRQKIEKKIMRYKLQDIKSQEGHLVRFKNHIRHSIDKFLFFKHKFYEKFTNKLGNIVSNKSITSNVSSLQTWAIKISYM